MATKIKRIGILTAGGDSPGLNAAIRGVGKAALGFYGMEIVGFRDGFRGLVENRRLDLDRSALSGILTIGGTILGTSRDKPHRMVIDGKTKDMTGVIRDNLKKWGIDCIVCLGGGGTQKSALRLHQAGINVITLPKTIDNDVAMTDATFGYATALDIATEASRPAAQHRAQPPPHHRGRDHGPSRRLADAGRRTGRRRGRDPDSRDSLQRGKNRRGHPPAQQAGEQLQHCGRGRGRDEPRRRAHL